MSAYHSFKLKLAIIQLMLIAIKLFELVSWSWWIILLPFITINTISFIISFIIAFTYGRK